MVAPWAERYIGVPFVAGGRSRNGADCWGLACLVYAEEFDRRLPLFDGARWSRAEAEALAAVICGEAERAWTRADDPQIGDIALYSVGGRPAHVGVAVSTTRALTTSPAIGAHLARVDSPRLGARSLGFWRLAL